MKTNESFFGTFLIDHLWRVLTRELDCSPNEASNHAEWFTKEARCFPQQDSQENYNAYAREEIVSHVGRRRLRKKPLKTAPRVTGGWGGPCVYWGGSRLCENCLNAANVAGQMKRAQELYEKQHDFVPFYLRMKGLDENLVEDMASQVWHNVASRVKTFTIIGAMEKDQATTARAWLKKVADSTVADYFDRENAVKRPDLVLMERSDLEGHSEDAQPEKPTPKTILPDAA